MEQRSASRMRAVLKAEIRYNDGLMSAPCVVRDISGTGARLELAGDLALPDSFDLYIEKKHETHHAVVKRRMNREVRVAFDDVVTKPAEVEFRERIAALEAEVADLRKLLEKMKGPADTAAEPMQQAAPARK